VPSTRQATTRRHSALGYLSPVDHEATLSMTPTTSDPST
jgi:hypothetical protein